MEEDGVGEDGEGEPHHPHQTAQIHRGVHTRPEKHNTPI